MSVLCEYGFWVKLNTLYVEFIVSDPHDLAIIGPCGHAQFDWTSCPLNRQGVVTVHRELRGQTRKYT